MSLKLTEKQKRFCDYYIESGNAADAAIRAGYSKRSAKQIGQENLTKPDLKKYIDQKLKELENQRIADAKEVMEYLTAVMRGEIDEEVVVVEGSGDGYSGARVLSKQVGARDRNKAAELLGKRYAMWTEKQQIDSSSVVKIIDDIEDDVDEED